MGILVSGALALTLVSAPQPERVPSSFSPIRDSIARLASTASLERAVAAPAPTPSKPQPSRAAKIGAGVLGGVAGFFGGLFIGYAIDRAHGCVCDDPGLEGIVIGAPVGAVAGAIFGTWIASR